MLPKGRSAVLRRSCVRTLVVSAAWLHRCGFLSQQNQQEGLYSLSEVSLLCNNNINTRVCWVSNSPVWCTQQAGRQVTHLCA